MKKLFLLGATTLLASSCWVSDMMITNLDNLVEHKVSDNLDLFHGQKDKLEKDTSKFLNELKDEAPGISSKLKEYEELARSAKKKIAPGLVEEELKYWQKLFIKKGKELIDKHTDYIANLTEGQQKAFFKKARKKNREMENKIKDNDIEDFAKGYEYAFGDLNEDQLKYLKERKDFFKEGKEESLKRRKQFQEELKNLFAKEAPLEEFKKLSLESLTNRFDESTTKEHAEIFAALVEKAGKEQINNLRDNIDRLQGWVETYVSTAY